jgi:hypothetical protein
VDGWVDGWMDGCVSSWGDGWVDRQQIESNTLELHGPLKPLSAEETFSLTIFSVLQKSPVSP